MQPEPEPARSEEVAEEVPLPSSPINIPSAAPVLGLDLGMPGMDFMGGEMPGATLPDHRDDETAKLRDPVNFASIGGAAGPKSSLPHVPDEVKANFTHPAIKQRPETPSEALLKLPSALVPHSPFELPATPLPGTNSQMDLDGANDTESSGKKSAVFERSVTPSTERARERKELRTMCSLDAIADACSNSHKGSNDSGLSPPAHIPENDGSQAGSPQADTLHPPRTNPFQLVPSASTISTCPSDMPGLERMKDPESRYYNFRLESEPSANWTVTMSPVEDPFDDVKAAASGPPSPTRSVKLPFRVRGKRKESGEEHGCVEVGKEEGNEGLKMSGPPKIESGEESEEDVIEEPQYSKLRSYWHSSDRS